MRYRTRGGWGYVEYGAVACVDGFHRGVPDGQFAMEKNSNANFEVGAFVGTCSVPKIGSYTKYLLRYLPSILS